MFAASALIPPSACYGIAGSQYGSAVTQQQSAQSAAAAAHQHRTPFIPAAMEMKGGGWQNAVIGPVLQCMEAATLGMPLEVWKTYMGRNRDATTLGAIRSIYQQGGGGFPGVAAFWAGTGPKVQHSAAAPHNFHQTMPVLLDRACVVGSLKKTVYSMGLDQLQAPCFHCRLFAGK